MSLSISAIPRVIRNFYTNNLGTVVFRSQPGIGKTDQVRDAVKQLSAQYGEEFGFVEEHLASRSEVDLRGYLIPTTDGQARYTKPDFWHVVEQYPRGILFLDELFQCTTEMQKAIAPLLQEKRIGENVLPDGWIVVGATNGVEHRSGVVPALSHVTNRICIMDVDPPTPDELAAYYMRHGTPAECIALVLKSPSTVLGLSPVAQGTPYCTPRSFKRVGDLMNTYGSPMEALTSSVGQAIIEGFIGKPAFVELAAICQLVETLPNMDEILADPEGTNIPVGVDKQWLIASMLGLRTTKPQLDTMFRYLQRFPDNIAFIGLYGCWQRGITDASETITKWVTRNHKLFEALGS